MLIIVYMPNTIYIFPTSPNTFVIESFAVNDLKLSLFYLCISLGVWPEHVNGKKKNYNLGACILMFLYCGSVSGAV